ncbi:MAG: hypothetical protein SPI03_01740 [Campylobacter sputorum]|uniref:hypothetical protein n=1 Tax=Campylobacter sputorum TaxID=206 RepID=UPI000B78B2C2|nr:hypothetical protein [Campylobacter sputorum]ASM38205.1 hypothetical protein CSPARA_0617 [Campylobacter sputorum bv. paraureolyticus LMG 11764]MDY6120050.1 hypothetical protein [Campylobacter sputorum]
MKKIIFFIILNINLFAIDGFTIYNTANIDKAKGLDMSIQIPNYLEPYQTYRPNVAMKFVDKNSRDMIMVLVYKDKEFEDMLIDESNYYEACKYMIDELNLANIKASLIDCRLINIEIFPAINMISKTTFKRVDKTLTSFSNDVMFFYKDYYIKIQSFYGSKQRLDNLSNLYFQVLNSIVINDLYK